MNNNKSFMDFVYAEDGISESKAKACSKVILVSLEL